MPSTAPAFAREAREGWQASFTNVDEAAKARLIPRSRIPFALRHKTVLGRTVQRLALCADCLAFAGVLLAFLHEAVFGGAVQRLALGADCVAFAGLCHGRADGKKCDRSCENQCCKSQNWTSYVFHRYLPYLALIDLGI
jgi:hypothetical protein